MGLFATLDRETCERIARAAADVSLIPGEFAAHEGDGPALFAVLEGRIEAVKLLDGVPKTVGERHPGNSSARCRSRSGPASRSDSRRPRRHA